MEKTASQVLRAARALIGTPDKWWKGGANGAGVSKCSAQAIYHQPGYDFDSLNFLSVAIGGKPGCYAHIFDWNDAPERTHADVMAAFDRAIALAEKDEPQRKPREDDATWAARMVSEVTKQDDSVGTTPASFTADEVATNK